VSHDHSGDGSIVLSGPSVVIPPGITGAYSGARPDDEYMNRWEEIQGIQPMQITLRHLSGLVSSLSIHYFFSILCHPMC
jgi:hypothetical protein